MSENPDMGHTTAVAWSHLSFAKVGHTFCANSMGSGGVFSVVFAAFDSVVPVGVAGGAEALVVEGEGAGCLFQFFAELVDGAEGVGSVGNLEFAGRQELLSSMRAIWPLTR